MRFISKVLRSLWKVNRSPHAMAPDRPTHRCAKLQIGEHPGHSAFHGRRVDPGTGGFFFLRPANHPQGFVDSLQAIAHGAGKNRSSRRKDATALGAMASAATAGTSGRRGGRQQRDPCSFHRPHTATTSAAGNNRKYLTSRIRACLSARSTQSARLLNCPGRDHGLERLHR